MGEWIPLVAAALTGALLGAVYFGGLWLTVRKVAFVGRPAALVTLSFAGRLALTLAGFYLASSGRVERLLACLVCFLLVRQLFLLRSRYTMERSTETHGNQS